MPESFRSARIIGALLLLALLCGCGMNMLRLSYGQAPSLAYWWLDGYADFDGNQTPRVRRAIDDWFAWHRRTQLPDYATLLVRAQTDVLQPATSAIACRWQEEAQRKLEIAFEQAVPAIAELAIGLSPSQLQHMERKFEKSNKQFREDFLQSDPAERREAAVERSVERAEMLYGPFDDAQLVRITAIVTASPFDPELWLTERRARQQDVLTLLRGVDRSKPGAAAAMQTSLRQFAGQMSRSNRPVYRAYQERLAEYNCSFAAQVHNLATPAQREFARNKLKGWEEDVRSLAAQPNGAP